MSDLAENVKQQEQKRYFTEKDIIQPRQNVKATYVFDGSGMKVTGDWFATDKLEVLIDGKPSKTTWFLMEPETNKPYYKDHWVDLIPFVNASDKNKPGLLKRLAKREFLLEAPEFDLNVLVPFELLRPIAQLSNNSSSLKFNKKSFDIPKWNEEKAFLEYLSHLPKSKVDELNALSIKTSYGNYNLFELALTLHFYDVAEQLYDQDAFFSPENCSNGAWMEILMSQRQSVFFSSSNQNSANAFTKKFGKERMSEEQEERLSLTMEDANKYGMTSLGNSRFLISQGLHSLHTQDKDVFYASIKKREWLTKMLVHHKEDLNFDSGVALKALKKCDKSFGTDHSTIVKNALVDLIQKWSKDKSYPVEKNEENKIPSHINSWEAFSQEYVEYNNGTNTQITKRMIQLDIEIQLNKDTKGPTIQPNRF